jgi:hypothetical protein
MATKSKQPASRRISKSVRSTAATRRKPAARRKTGRARNTTTPRTRRVIRRKPAPRKVKPAARSPRRKVTITVRRAARRTTKPKTLKARTRPRTRTTLARVRRTVSAAPRRPSARRRIRPVTTADTVPPFFPELETWTETGGSESPAFVMHGGRRIEIPPVLLQSEHAPAGGDAGDGRLHLAARDPHWLYVHWDFTRAHQAQLNAQSRHGHLIVRVFRDDLHGECGGENHVHPQSRHWFVHVETPGATYFAELGYYAASDWHRLATAGPVTTPPRRAAPDRTATYLTLHPDRPLEDQLPPPVAGPDGTAAERVDSSAPPSAETGDTDFDLSAQAAILQALGFRWQPTYAGPASGSGAGAEISWAGLGEIHWVETSPESSGGGFPPADGWLKLDFAGDRPSSNELAGGLNDPGGVTA